MVKINDEYKVTVEKQDHFGWGLVHVDNFLVFIEKGLKGDEVVIKITNVKKRYAVATIKEIINSSLERVESICPYYDDCGGCQIMHQEYTSQLKFKEMKVKELFSKFINLRNAKFYPILHGNEIHYRNKVIFHGSKEQLGFFKEKTHDIISIPSCLLVEKELDDIYRKVLTYQKSYTNTEITDLMLRKTNLNEIMISVDGIINKDKFVNYMDNNLIKSIYINEELVYGKKSIIEEIYDMKFHILPKAFFQVNDNMMRKLYQIVIDYYKENEFNQILDLYCGTGTIGMLVSPYVKKVIGVEVVEDAIISAKMNQELNQISNIQFLLGKVENYIESFQDIDSIIVDPPRSGLDKVTVEQILKIEPTSIVYVSCDPSTLVRDLNMLSQKYDILEVHLVDMFPNTYHCETICVLERK